MSVCVNDTDGDGDCPACARNPEAPCRVSARDEALDLVEKILPREHAKAYRELFSKKFDAYAHELAEKVRANKVRQPYGEAEEHLNWALDTIADEMDPEVSNSGG